MRICTYRTLALCALLLGGGANVPAQSITETFNGTALPNGWRELGGTVRVANGVLTLRDGCVELPGMFGRSTGVSVEFDIRFTAANDDTNLWALYDTATCGSGPRNGYSVNWFPRGGNNATDSIGHFADGRGRDLETTPTRIQTGVRTRVRVEFRADGTISSFINGTRILTAANAQWTQGRIGLRSLGTVEYDNLTVTGGGRACDPPLISSHPESQTAALGESIILRVSASSPAGGSLSYRWYEGPRSNTARPIGTNGPSLTVAPLATTSYWVRVTNACGSADSNAATITLAASSIKRSIFVIHGIEQSSEDVRALSDRLRASLPADSYEVNGGFSYEDCAQDRNCPGDCTVTEIARRLNNYIKASSPNEHLILVGYSLGGLVARTLLLEFQRSMDEFEIDGLITLGTPHLGYPFAGVDLDFRCKPLIVSMASFYYQPRISTGVNLLPFESPTMNPFLASLNYLWAYTSFKTRPKRWLAVAGTYCSDSARVVGDNACKDDDRSDGVVCRASALAEFEPFSNDRSIDRVSFDEFAHSEPRIWKALLFGCFSDAAPSGYLFDPDQDSGVFRRMLLFIRGL